MLSWHLFHNVLEILTNAIRQEMKYKKWKDMIARHETSKGIYKAIIELIREFNKITNTRSMNKNQYIP